jgi:glycosyltransferase involved in cell wall biosynthesis
MEKIGMLTFSNLNIEDGSSMRPVMETKGLKINGFDNFCIFSPHINKNLELKQKQIKEITLKQAVILNKKINLDVNVIHAQQTLGAFVSNKQKYIFDMHAIDWLSAKAWYKKHKNIFRKIFFGKIYVPYYWENVEKKLIKNAEYVLAACQYVKDEIQKMNNIEVVRNSIDPGMYKPTKCKDTLIGAIGPFTKGGGWGPEQIKHIYKIAKDSEYEIWLIGKIDKKYLDLFKEYKNVKCLGYVKDFKETLRNISILLLAYPDSCISGGARYKLLEAAACNIPIVSTPYGMMGFEEEDLIMVGETTEELLERLKELEDYKLRKELGSKLRNVIVKNYNYIIESKKLIKIYNDL